MAEITRLADRLRSLSDARLRRPLPAGPTAADAAHTLAQRLADAAARLEGRAPREVPRLHDLAVGDQVAVTGQDLATAAATRARAGDPAGAELAAAVDACRALSAVL